MVEQFAHAVIDRAEKPAPLAHNDAATAAERTTNLRQWHIAEAADIAAAYSMTSHGHSWAANKSALAMAGIQAPDGNASDITAIPGMTRMPADTRLQPGDVVTVGATPGRPFGNSFIVTPDMKAANESFHSIPDLSKLQDVRIFRAEK